MHRNGVKKRKHDRPLDDIERSLYSTFSSAANGISVLYTLSLTQQRKAYCLGSKHFAEKLLNWISENTTETPHGEFLPENVSTSYLVNYLRCELADVEGTVAELTSLPAGIPTSSHAPPPTSSHPIFCPTSPQQPIDSSHQRISAGRSARHPVQEGSRRTRLHERNNDTSPPSFSTMAHNVEQASLVDFPPINPETSSSHFQSTTNLSHLTTDSHSTPYTMEGDCSQDMNMSMDSERCRK